MKAVSWKEDGQRKFWSEAHVSEDFDMSLRLQTQGYVQRVAGGGGDRCWRRGVVVWEWGRLFGSEVARFGSFGCYTLSSCNFLRSSWESVQSSNCVLVETFVHLTERCRNTEFSWLHVYSFIGRYATYTGAGFQEGVSLTCVDEVIRLRKYAYGACEMLLNKFKVRGPLLWVSLVIVYDDNPIAI